MSGKSLEDYRREYKEQCVKAKLIETPRPLMSTIREDQAEHEDGEEGHNWSDLMTDSGCEQNDEVDDDDAKYVP